MTSTRWIAGLVACAVHLGTRPSSLFPLPSQRPDSAISIDTLAYGLFLLHGGADGNVLVSTGPSGTVLVDTRSPATRKALLAALAEVAETPVRAVINTHYHEDHTGNNEVFTAAGAEVVAHRRARFWMNVESYVPDMRWTRRRAPVEAWPKRLMTDTLTLRLSGQELRLRHVPVGHTDGDLVVHAPLADVVFAGDLVELGAYPFIDVWSGGSVDGLIAATDTILRMAGPGTRIVPGHGGVTGRDSVAAYRAMLVLIRDRVLAGIRAGRTWEQIATQRPTAEFDAGRGGPVDGERFTRLVWLSLWRARGEAAPAPIFEEARP